ncbi:hypothetical protein K9L97_04820 [Candidatus Woesearchaeota archaeon]|nr:hypothetical protein [Candidatus Woesearchaeota archaeon]
MKSKLLKYSGLASLFIGGLIFLGTLEYQSSIRNERDSKYPVYRVVHEKIYPRLYVLEQKMKEFYDPSKPFMSQQELSDLTEQQTQLKANLDSLVVRPDYLSAKKLVDKSLKGNFYGLIGLSLVLYGYLGILYDYQNKPANSDKVNLKKDDKNE